MLKNRGWETGLFFVMVNLMSTYTITLPNKKTMDIDYSEDVFDPNYSHYRDTIGLADMCIKEVNPSRVVDVGCGCGILGLAIKKLNPFLDVTLADVDEAAVAQTQINAIKLGLQVTVLKKDLLLQLQYYPVVIANLPTFNNKQVEDNELHGPEVAYRAHHRDGLRLYKKLLKQLKAGQFLVCEIQEKLQPKFLELLATMPQFTIVAKSEMAFAIFCKPTIVLSAK